MTKFFLKNLIVLLSLSLASCSYFKKTDSSRKIRIVDLQGKSHGVKTRTPILNAQILESQGKSPSLYEDAQYAQRSVSPVQTPQPVVQRPDVSQSTNANKYPTADYNAAASELASQNPQLQDTLNTAQNTTKIVSKTTAGNVVAEKEVEIEYDLSDVKPASSSPPAAKRIFGKAKSLGTHKISLETKKTSPATKKTFSIRNSKGIFVQTGAFSTLRNAKNSSEKIQKFGDVQIEESKANDKNIYRVLLGPFPSTTSASQVVKKVKSAGHDAIIVRKD